MTRATAIIGLVLLAATACGDGAGRPERNVAKGVGRAQLVAVAHPDLTGVGAELRGQIAELRSEVESAPDAGDADSMGQAWGDLARAYHAYGFFDAAAAAYDNARALQPDLATWPYLAGLLQRQRGHHQVAVESFRRALEIDPQSSVTKLHLAEALLDLGPPEEAAALLEAAAKSPPHAAAALAALGRAARDRGDAAGAVELYQQALRAQPAADLLHHSIAAAYRSLGNEARAIEELALAGTRAPVYPDPAADGLEELRTTTGALLLRGSRALVTERPREAVEQYRRAVAAAPQDAEAHRSLALALRASGDLAGALAQLEEAARLEPASHVVLFDLGNLQLARGAQQAAADAFAKSLAARPDFVPARFNLANAQILLGQTEPALANLEQVIALDPDHQRARYQAAMAKGTMGRGPEALQDLEALLAADPGYGPAILGMAELRRRAGDRGAARTAYRELIDRGSDPTLRVDGLVGLASLAKEEGHAEEELEHLAAAVELAPERDDLREALARAYEAARRFLDAAAQRQALAEIHPQAVMNRLLEATDWVQGGRAATARQRLEEAVARFPEERLLANSLARLLATAREPEVRDGDRSVEIARGLYASEPTPDAAETLAMALAEAGEWNEAVAVQRGLIAQVRGAGQTGHLPRLEQNLRRYERGEPVRM